MSTRLNFDPHDLRVLTLREVLEEFWPACTTETLMSVAEVIDDGAGASWLAIRCDGTVPSTAFGSGHSAVLVTAKSMVKCGHDLNQWIFPVPILSRALRRHHGGRYKISGKNEHPKSFREIKRTLTPAELRSQTSFSHQLEELTDDSQVPDTFLPVEDLSEKERRLELCLCPGPGYEWISHHTRWFAWSGSGREIWVRGFWRRRVPRKAKV